MLNEYMRTSVEDMYAAVDCHVVEYNPANADRYIPLVTNAIHMGTLITENLVDLKLRYLSTQGALEIKFYEKCIVTICFVFHNHLPARN